MVVTSFLCFDGIPSRFSFLSILLSSLILSVKKREKEKTKIEELVFNFSFSVGDKVLRRISFSMSVSLVRLRET